MKKIINDTLNGIDDSMQRRIRARYSTHPGNDHNLTGVQNAWTTADKYVGDYIGGAKISGMLKTINRDVAKIKASSLPQKAVQNYLDENIPKVYSAIGEAQNLRMFEILRSWKAKEQAYQDRLVGMPISDQRAEELRKAEISMLSEDEAILEIQRMGKDGLKVEDNSIIQSALLNRLTPENRESYSNYFKEMTPPWANDIAFKKEQDEMKYLQQSDNNNLMFRVEEGDSVGYSAVNVMDLVDTYSNPKPENLSLEMVN